MKQLKKIFFGCLILKLSIFNFHFSIAQSDTTFFIEGKIIDYRTKQALPFAHIYNPVTQKGTISNGSGYYKLTQGSFTDSIIVSYIGYKNQKIKFEKGRTFYSVFLEPSTNELEEVVVVAKDNSYLFDLIAKAKKNVSVGTKTGKAYFDLKSYYDNRQVEQVEAFYNAEVNNYDPVGLSIKIGRIALREYEEKLFTSLETSRVFTMQQLFKSSDYFPMSPLELNGKKGKKYFSAALLQKYADDENDSVYVIRFLPKKDSSDKFITTVWLKPDVNRIIKVKYEIKKAAIHPFFPLFKSDSIKSMDMEITKTFTSDKNKPLIDHIDFIYSINYKSRDQKNYNVTTKALLHIFDYKSTFDLPFFEFSDNLISDYRKINAIPHNDYFWNNYEGFKMSDQYGENNEFFNHPLSVTNKKIFSANKYGPFGLMEQPYVQWTGKRILFKEKDTVQFEDAPSVQHPGFKALFYDLSVKVFLDINYFGDSLQIVSKTIFDPFESYFQLEMNRSVQCFINIYFDLVEIERKKLMEEIAKSDMKLETIQELHRKSKQSIFYLKEKYFRETERGTKFDNLEKWNKIVKKELGIDNVSLFFNTGN